MRERRSFDRPRAARGFTLIELMVALGMALAVTSAALGVLLVVVDTQRQGVHRNALARDAQLVLDVLGNDLAYLGVGVPRGYQLDDNGDPIDAIPGDAAKQLRPPVRIATTDYLAFFGDLPYPNADLNGTAQPSVFKDGNDHKMGVVSELSPCTPPKGGGTSSGNYACSSQTRSLVDLAGLGGNCNESNPNEPSCPWGMNKWQRSAGGNVHLVVGAINGGWFRRKWNMTNVTNSKDRMMLHLVHWAPTGNEDLPEELFRSNIFGGGFFTTLDRVFYSLENEDGTRPCTAGGPCTLRRRQCWGWADTTSPNHGEFPGPAASAFSSASDPIDCAPGGSSSNGTRWETVMDDIESFELRYFDSAGAALTPPLVVADLSKLRVVEVSLTLARTLPGKPLPLQHTVQRRWFLEGAGGIITGGPGSTDPVTPLANGGCWTSAAGGPPNECNPQ